MKPCPACGTYNPPTYAVCQKCAGDLPKGSDARIYGRGLIELAKTRAGIRVITMMVAFIIAAIYIAVLPR